MQILYQVSLLSKMSNNLFFSRKLDKIRKKNLKTKNKKVYFFIHLYSQNATLPMPCVSHTKKRHGIFHLICYCKFTAKRPINQHPHPHTGEHSFENVLKEI